MQIKDDSHVYTIVMGFTVALGYSVASQLLKMWIFPIQAAMAGLILSIISLGIWGYKYAESSRKHDLEFILGAGVFGFLIGFAIPTDPGFSLVALSIRLALFAGGIGFLGNCQHVPTKLEQKLKEQADKLAAEQAKNAEATKNEWNRLKAERERLAALEKQLGERARKLHEETAKQRQGDRETLTKERAQLQQERENFNQYMEQQKAAARESLQRELNSMEAQLNQLKTLANRELERQALTFEQKEQGYLSRIEQLQIQCNSLMQQLRASMAPILPKGVRDLDLRCIRIQQIFYKSEIILDCSKEEPMTDLSREVFLLYPRDTKYVPQVMKKSDEFRMQLEALYNDSGAIKIEQVGAAIRITYDPKGESLAMAAKKS